jgi:phage gpG-like protein
MSEIDQYISSLDNISLNLKKIVFKAVKKNQGQILSMVKLRLFNKGVDGSGSKITPDYAPQTISIKKGKRQRSSHVTLRDSGNLYRSFVVEFKNNNIFIQTNVDYKKDLISKYGSEIFDLTINEVELIIYAFAEPEIQKELNKLGL